MRYFIAIFFVLAFGASLIYQNQDQKSFNRLSIGTNVWPGYEALYVARENQFLEENQFKLVEYGSATQVMRAFKNKTIDFAALTLDETLQLIDQNHPLKIILVTDISNGGDAIIAKSDLKFFNQLKGKKVGCETSALGRYILNRALQLNNMSTQDIHIINSRIDQHYTDFNTKKVDAVVTFDPVRQQLVDLGAKTVFDSSEIPGEIIDVLVVQEGIYKTYKTQLQSLLKAWFKSLNYIKHNPRKSASQMSKRLNLNIEQIIHAFELLKLPNLKENIGLFDTNNPSGIINTSKALSQTMLRLEMLKEEIMDLKPYLGTELLDNLDADEN